MKQCSVCGMAKDDNPAHSSDYSGPGKHAFSKAEKSVAFLDEGDEGLSVGLNDESPVAFGGAVKALGIEKINGVEFGTLEGPAVIFSGEGDGDIANDFFTKSTDYFFETDDFKAVRPVIYDHGLDDTMKSKKISRATLEIREDDVWFKTQLDLSDKYNKFVYKLAELGKLGTSTGSAPHLIQREAVGKSTWIKAWPIVELSLTTKPVEPKTKGKVLALKSYSDIERCTFVKSIEGLEGSEEVLPPPPTPEEVSKRIVKSPMKSLFETKLAERTESIYDLQSTFQEVCRDIVQAAEAEDITGVTIDVAAKVAEAGAEYLNRLVPLAVQQMTQWLKNKQNGDASGYCEGAFWLRSLPSLLSESPLKGLLSIEDSLVTGGALDEHSTKVVTAVEEYASMSKSLVPKLNVWVERLGEKLEFRANDATKSGRTLSKATLQKLGEVVTGLKEALASGGMTLEAFEKLLDEATPKKALADGEYASILFAIENTKHLNEMAGV